MKKILLVLLTCVLVLSLVACGGSKLEKWIESDEGEEFVKMVESGLEGMADAKVTAKGDTLTVKMDIRGIDDLTADQKDLIASQYEGQEEMLKDLMGDADEVPGLKKVVYKVCEEDGDLITNVEVEF